MSGEALTSAQAAGLSPVTAIDDWVRARVCRAPLRTPAQLRQLQFHCGKPPPAAEPNTRIFTGDLTREWSRVPRSYRVNPATRLERTVASASPHTQGREPGRRPDSLPHARSAL